MYVYKCAEAGRVFICVGVGRVFICVGVKRVLIYVLDTYAFECGSANCQQMYNVVALCPRNFGPLTGGDGGTLLVSGTLH